MDEANMDAPKTVIMTTGHSLEPTMAERETVKQMEPKISRFVVEHLQDNALLGRFRSSREKIAPQVIDITPVLAKKIMEDMGIEYKDDKDYYEAYHIMGTTQNFAAIWETKPPLISEQQKKIQQEADTLANYLYDSGLSEAENIANLDRVLMVLDDSGSSYGK